MRYGGQMTRVMCRSGLVHFLFCFSFYFYTQLNIIYFSYYWSTRNTKTTMEDVIGTNDRGTEGVWGLLLLHYYVL
jgi:hypothetical protein